MIKAIAFDLDETLIDFLSMKKKTARAAAKAMVSNGLKANEAQLYRQIFLIYDRYGIEYQKTFAKVLKKYKLNRNQFEKILQAGIIAYSKTKHKTLKPYPEVIPALKKLKKNYKLAVITDAPREKAWQRLILCNLQNHFDAVITSTDTGKLKPNKLPFKELLKNLALNPTEVLMVGDNFERDIKGAERVGMKAVLVREGRLGKIYKKLGQIENP